LKDIDRAVSTAKFDNDKFLMLYFYFIMSHCNNLSLHYVNIDNSMSNLYNKYFKQTLCR